jgi:3-dehydroquinate synthase
MSRAPAAAARPPTKVTVDLGSRSYDILIGRGLLGLAGVEIARRLPGARVAVVTDETVAGLHLRELTDPLGAAGIGHVVVTVPPGEGSKSFAALETVTDAILAARLERRDAVIAFGGGVVGDLAGFAAGVTLRGMHLVQVPTTLLAQVDSSVGGKTGINTPRGKNLVGLFQQPDFVLADAGILDSLMPRQFNAGYAEVAKYGLIGDAGFFAWLEANWRAVAAGWPEREHAITVSCRAKAASVAADERDQGVRALLNFGHTFAHALEAATGYSDRLVHGEAVAIGMVLAFRFSARLQLCPPADGDRVAAHLAAVGLPTAISAIPGEADLRPERLLDLMAHDKKVSRGRLTFILTRGIGQAFVADNVAPTDALAFLKETVAG